MLVSISRIRSNPLVHNPGNIRSSSDSRESPRRFVLMLVVLLLGVGVGAQEDPGSFEVRAASVELASEIYFLNAWIEYRLSSEATEALESGLSLTIRLEVELLNRRRFWIDTESASLTQLYQLEYHALTERYLARSLNSGIQRSFATLISALDYLGRIERLPLIDVALLDPDRRYDIRLRAVLDTEQLPGPLRLLAFWRRDWSLGSDWYRWRLEES